jgi:hypothetical protein
MSDDYQTLLRDYDGNVLLIDTYELKADFITATYQAIESMADEFTFHGFLIGTDDAIDITRDLMKNITIH